MLIILSYRKVIFNFDRFKAIISYDYPDDPRKEVDQLTLDYIGMDVIFLGGAFLLFFILLIFTEYGYSVKKASATNNQSDALGIKDEEVLSEIQKANDFTKGSDRNSEDFYSIRILNMIKNYSSGCTTIDINSVNKLSLCLKYGECFALLGVNGAGKTSTFRCLTNEESITSGKIFIDGMDITDNFSEIRNLVGYCPQFDAIFEYLTVYENLEFYSNIKGINPEKLEIMIDSLMTELNLKQYRDKISGRLR